jgi:hypothetical protein
MRYIVLFPLLTALIRAQECRLSNVHGDFMVLQRAPQTTTLCVKLAAERARRGRGGARRRGRARRAAAATPVVGTPNFLTPPHTPTNIRYGFARPNTVITTTFRGTNLTATALASGEWRQALPATPASAPSAGGETISFSCATGEAFALRNVLWGDVVLCGGQSSAWHEQQRALGPQKPTLRPPLPTHTHTPSNCRHAVRLQAEPPSAAAAARRHPAPSPCCRFTVHSIGDEPGWNATAEIAAANAYPGVRTTTVGQVFTSMLPLNELGAPPTLPWSPASAATIGCGDWNCTSAVCWCVCARCPSLRARFYHPVSTPARPPPPPPL